MAWILAVTSKTERVAQSVGDIVGVYDFEPTTTEKGLFQCIKVEKVKKQEIDEMLQARLDEKKLYPKFPHHVKSLTVADKTAIADSSTLIADIRARLDKVTTKNPTGDAPVESQIVEK